MAKQLQFHGDYSAARKRIAQVLREAEDEYLLQEARFALAECYYLDGLYSETIVVLGTLLDEHPQSHRQSQALFMLAESYAEGGVWLESADAFMRFLETTDTVLVDTVQSRIAYAYRKAGHISKAETAYEAALDASVNPQTTRMLLRDLAGMLVLQGDNAGALAHYEQLAELAETSHQVAEAELRQAEVLLLMGTRDEAEAHLRAAMEAEPTSLYAYESLVKLVDAELEVEPYLRGFVDFHNGAYLQAIDALHEHLESGSSQNIAETRDMLARSYQVLGTPALAVIEWDRLIDGHRDSDLWGDAWLQKARLLRSEEGFEQAMQILDEFLEMSPDHDQAPQALWIMASWVEGSGDYREAADLWLSLQKEYPASDLADNALMLAAISEYRVARYRQSEDHLSELRRSYPDYRPQNTLLWLGKARLARGSEAGAIDAWEELLTLAPDGYAATRARALAQEEGLNLTSAEGWSVSEAESGRAEAEDWLADWAPRAGSTSEYALSTEVSGDIDLARGLELLNVGERDLGNTALESAMDRWWDDPWALLGLAELFRDRGAYRLSIVSSYRIIELSPDDNKSKAPGYLLKLTYPTYYSELVQQEAASNDLDPLLLYAIIRQESLFESGARSHAAAQGLMQVIPDTGDWVATRLGWSDYYHELLYRPYVSVAFGAYYFAFVLNDAGGDLISGLVGYNAGPGNARIWRSLSGDDDDLFVETLGALEPQTYVRRIVEQYSTYRALYGETSEQQ